MNMFELALILDDREYVVEAALTYEIAIAEEVVPIDAYLNLAVLYFTCLDFGYAARQRISNDFVEVADRRCREMLDRAERRFRVTGELRFWRMYFDAVEYGQGQPVEAWVTLAREHDTDLPYVWLAVFVDDREYGDRASAAVARFTSLNTSRGRLLRSLMSSRRKADQT